MAKRAKTTDESQTQAAIAGVKQLAAWNDSHPIYIYDKDTPVADRKPENAKSSTARRNVFQVDLPNEAFVGLVDEAASIDGAMKDGDLTDGVLARVARRYLLPAFMPSIDDVDAWEEERARLSGKARGERLKKEHAKASKAKTMAEKLVSADMSPELAAQLAALGITASDLAELAAD